NDCFAVNILAEGERNFCVLLRRLPVGRLEELAQFHRHLAGIGKLNSDGVFAGNRGENIGSFWSSWSCKVWLRAYHFVQAHAFGRINFVARDGWTLRDVPRPNGDSKLGQRVDENLLYLL